MSERAMVFISCGQLTPEEKRLGDAIAKLVEELTPFRGFFAEQVNSLDGLTNNILRAIDEAVGFIAVMHPRGVVSTPHGQYTRASVWVEQEIAIAAHLVHVQQKQLHVLAYAHESVHLEGIREKLQLNPIRFSSNEQVLTHLSSKLPTWSGIGGARLQVLINSWVRFDMFRGEWVLGPSAKAEVKISISLKNEGQLPVSRYDFEVEVPTELLKSIAGHVHLSRKTATHSHYWFSKFGERGTPIYPADVVEVVTLSINLSRPDPHYEEKRRLSLNVAVHAGATNSSVSKTMG